MDSKQLRKAGESLARNDPQTYGRGWQSALAREIGVGSRTVRAWLSGEAAMSNPTGMLIDRLVDEARRR